LFSSHEKISVQHADILQYILEQLNQDNYGGDDNFFPKKSEYQSRSFAHDQHIEHENFILLKKAKKFCIIIANI